MAARLLQFEDGRQVGVFELRRVESLIGRDPAADCVLQPTRISRRHALVREQAGGYVLVDLGSANGTTLNGHPVQGEVPLESGDRIGLAGEALLEFRLDKVERGRWYSSALVLLLLLAVGGGWYWYSSRPDPVILDAAATAWNGVEAHRSGEARAARGYLDSAMKQLYEGRQLDDVPRYLVRVEAMKRLRPHLPEDVDLVAVYQDVEWALKVPVPEPAPVAGGPCRLDRVSGARFNACLRDQLHHVLAALYQPTDIVPDWFYQQVAETLAREHRFIRGALPRGKPYVADMKRTLEERHMPPLLHYLSMIESGYRPGAGSPAGAVGLWQFMPGTAKRYGLKLKPVDQRKDPERSTRAAAEYLRDLAFEFGGDSLLLALAGYNRGENGVRRSLRQLENPFDPRERSYFRLVEKKLLPAETRKYVARFMAAAVAGEGGLPSREQLRAAGY